MSGEPLRFGLIGCGGVGDLHAWALAEIPNARLVAVYDVDSQRVTNLARTYDVDVSQSVDELIERTDLDAVILATPTDRHHPQTLAAAGTGKHVLVEKPATLSVGDLDEMQGACDRAGVVLMVGQTLRFQDVSQALFQSIQSGDIGEPVYASWITNSARNWRGGWQSWQADPQRSGGMAVHLGIHGIDLALWLLGSAPQRVYAQGANISASDPDFRDYVHISIRCASGVNALVELHLALPGKANYYQAAKVLGTAGQSQWSLTDDGLSVDSGGTRSLYPSYAEGIRAELVHFIDVCRGDAELLITAEQARWSLAAALAAQESLRTGKAIDVTPMLEGQVT